LAAAVRRRVDDEGALAVGRRHRIDRAQVDARWDHLGLGHPARSVVGSDDLRTGAAAPRELLAALAPDVRAKPVHDRLLAERAQERELQRLRQERQAEVEVEEIGLRREPRERAELRGLARQEATRAGEAPV